MSYRKRNNYSRKLKNMREKRLRDIQEGVCPDYPLNLPELRRTVIIQDFDFGTVEHKIDLYKTNRIDVYDMIVDGKLYAKNVGWSSVLEIVRKQFVRVHSL